MKNAAIITICDNSNYGNRLQNYALHKVLDSIGISNQTLWDEKENTIGNRVKLFIKRIVPTDNVMRLRKNSFEMFTRRNIKNKYVDLEKLEKLNDNFDYFIVGSDQIWNYNFGHARDKDFLKFADYNTTISYAPSFGISKVDVEWENKISNGINHIKYL